MRSNQQYISKGFYKYSQINNFISVKNYIFIRQGGKKCLLLRFSNDMEYQVDSMRFTVVQLDSSGKILKQTKITFEKINFAPGGTYTTSSGIVIDEYCSDFKILFNEVYSGRYKYQVRNGNVVAHYLKKLPPIEGDASGKSYATDFSVKPRRFGRAWLAVLVCVIVLLSVIVFNLYSLFSDMLDFDYLDSGNKQSEFLSDTHGNGSDEEELFTLR